MSNNNKFTVQETVEKITINVNSDGSNHEQSDQLIDQKRTVKLSLSSPKTNPDNSKEPIEKHEGTKDLLKSTIPEGSSSRDDKTARKKVYIESNETSKSNGHLPKERTTAQKENPNKGMKLHKEDVVAKKPFDLDSIRSQSIEKVGSLAQELNIANVESLSKQEIIFQITKHLAPTHTLSSSGVLEILPEGYGFMRFSSSNYFPSPDNIYISPGQIRKMGLRTGDEIRAELRVPKKDEKYCAITKIISHNSKDCTANVTTKKRCRNFDSCVPIYPNEQINLETENPLLFASKPDISHRIIDIIAPLGKGQRALIVAPPKTGKTVLLQSIAHSINTNHPDIHVIVLLIDERPEEVTDMQRSVKGEVVSSTFDEPAFRHVQLSEIVIEKARRMVEQGKDVVILLDSITRLARAYNTVIPSSGKILTGGVDSNALQKPKRFFGSARNLEFSGSLTIIATALIDTGSRMDEVIFEEFKGTGNSEIVLDRKIADKRIFPAIDITRSGTRKEEVLISPELMHRIWVLRRILSPMGSADAMDFLYDKISKTKNNLEFFGTMNSKTTTSTT
ncbi:MAG: transcription termination factor Rho [Candidatus Xenolissoclinum pacificiensis L6]|uniref:Transcription termination factor Rho n=1 Tax=Candidatus Xenolissoclinum pacificiensis L6 TaxID=1401685 RepID=W2V0K1_9RICK|nr:MAG: transcription termination factor Rho [Candidatus Xenolissoclinum pacificiensis L6]